MRENLIDDGPRGDARDDPHRPVAPDARKAVIENAAREELVGDLADDGSPLPVRPFEAIV